MFSGDPITAAPQAEGCTSAGFSTRTTGASYPDRPESYQMTTRIPVRTCPIPGSEPDSDDSELFSTIAGLFNKIPVMLGVTADCQPKFTIPTADRLFVSSPMMVWTETDFDLYRSMERR